jgi:hypothetical protein
VRDVGQILTSLTSEAQSRLELWEKFINRVQAEDILEIGVWRGAFAAQMLKQCPSIRRYYMIDPWRRLDDWNKPLNTDDSQQEETFQTAMGATRFAESKRVVLRGVTLEVIDRIPDESLDLVYIDGDHSLRGIAIDLISAYPKVKAGGYIVGDDFAPSIWQHRTQFEPSLVFPFSVYFAEAVGMPMFALPYSQFVIAKESSKVGHRFTDYTGKYGNRGLRAHVTLGALAKRRAKELIGLRDHMTLGELAKRKAKRLIGIRSGKTQGA